MALSKYIARVPPKMNLANYINQELRGVERTTNAIIDLIKALEVPVEVGPADSGGVGFRVLRIPN